MADVRPLDRYGPLLERFVWDGTDEQFAIQALEDAEPVVEANKRRYACVAAGDIAPSRDFRLVARIPVGVLYQWIKTYGVDPTARGNEALLTRLLNDPEWRHLRTAPGRV